MRRFAVILSALPLALMTSGLGPVSAQSRAADPVFSPVTSRIPAHRASVPQPGADDPRYLRSRLATVDLNLIVTTPAARPLRFNLFRDADLAVVFDEVIRRGRDGFSLLGHVVGAPVSSVLFEQVDNVMVGAIETPGRAFVVRYAGNGLHSILEARPTVHPPHDDFIPVAVELQGRPALPAQAKKSTFNYLGLYTKAALAAQGGKAAMKATVRATVTRLQAALKAQRVKHKVKFRGIKPVKGGDSGNLQTALQAVTNQTDGVYDRAGKQRNKKAADFVGLYIVGDGTGFGFCGLGWTPSNYNPTNERFAYHTVREDCNARDGGNTGAHETLHNMGGCHPNVAGDQCFNGATPNGAGHGFQNVPQNFQTVLGTGAICARCVSLMTVSGPRTFQGAKVTDKNSKVSDLVNKGAKTYAGYR